MKYIVFMFLFSARAFAGDWNCEKTIGDDRYRFSTAEPSAGAYDSHVWVNGKEVPSLGPCFVSERPSTRFVRCSHQKDSTRIEINLWSETVSGKITDSTATFWDGQEPTSYDLNGC